MSDAPSKLQWLDPVINRNGSGHQLAAGTEYEVRKTLRKDGPPMYWAWHSRKLLGYSTEQTEARGHCEARNTRVATCL